MQVIMSQAVGHVAAPPLPATVQDLLELRKNKSLRTLNDQVEELYLMLFNDPEFTSYTEAVYDEQAVEGSLAIDNAKAAEMLRDKAREVGNEYVSKQKLASLIKSMNVVQRRYGISRNERRSMVHGEVTPDAE